jgi:cell division protein FtsI (penicillin-binding protein 3)
VDDVGQEGLELAFEDWLRGVPGRRQVMQDRRGRIIEELNTIQTARAGKRLELSIDFRLQNLAYRELKAEFITRRAKSATVVVLDVATGEVLAMANQPSYNPHNKVNMTDFSVLRNRAITDVFEPGSTIKVFTIAAALESGIYSVETVIETSPG